MKDLHLHDFGIYLELTPDDEEKAMLENNIQTALSGGLIDLSDAIDIREVQNIKLANQLLKVRQKKRQERLQEEQQANIQAQANANAQAQQVAAQAEVQKDQALFQTKSQLEQLKSQLENQRIGVEVDAKKQLMALEFQYNMQLKGMEVQNNTNREKEIEDRKDERAKIIGTQQSEMISQRKNDTPPKNFESGGNDIMGGGFGLGSFEPK
jgi:multidrug efflux pump subunit AcrA (membrane-fusion protein)